MERRLLGDVEEKQLKVDIKKEYRYVVPTVRLERKQISMLNPPPGHASAQSIASISDTPNDNTRTRIVGEKGPPEEDGSRQVATANGHRQQDPTDTAKVQTEEHRPQGTRSEEQNKTEEKPTTPTQESICVTKETTFKTQEQNKELQEINQEQTRSGTKQDTKDHDSRALGRNTMHFSQQFPKEESAQILEFFEEQDHSLEEGSPSLSLLVVPAVHTPSQKSPRSPSPSSLHASVGLSHLDNLIRLMEQLSTLRDENMRLRKKCDYLETTKQLLQARNELVLVDPHTGSFRSLPAKQKHKSQEKRKEKDVHRTVRPRLPSAEDVQCMDISESASDHRSERQKGSIHKRSFSTGSLEVEIIDETTTSHGREVLISKSKSGKNILGTKSPGSKQKAKSSKWARVKKVLTGQKLYEDLGTTIRSLKELGRSSQRYSSVSTTHDVSPPSQRMVENRSLDSGVSTSLDTDSAARLPRTSTSSTEPSSSGRSPNQTGETAGPVEELGTEIWMGPPGWWEQYEARKQSEASSSDVSSVIEVKTMYLGSKQKDSERLLRVKTLTRRQSSPSLTSKDVEDKAQAQAEELSQVHRSSSCKGEDLDLSKEGALGKSERDAKKTYRTAWGRVKEMMHVRKDSVKKRSHRDRDRDGLELSQSEEVSEGDVEGLMEENWSGDFADGVMSRSTPKTSPMVVPRQASAKSFSESPPQITLDASPPSRMASSAGSAEMAALLAGSLSEKFTQKMIEWQEIQLKKSPSFKTTPTEGEGEVLGTDGTGDNQELLQTQETADRAKTKGSLQQSGEIPPEAVSELTPLDLLGPSVNVEELQRRISESFCRKLAEWERRKYRRPDTPDMERKGSGRSRREKEERGRSKKSREEKERERQEKAREREMQKVEREQVKLEKEKSRIEKERQRALERQAKLERMKDRLSQADTEAPSGSPLPSPGLVATLPPPSAAQEDPLAKYKVSADFARKLQEWEMMKGAGGQEAGVVVAPGSPGGQGRPPPLTLQPYMDSPEETSPVDKTSEVSYGDDASVTDENMTKSKIASLERANNKLLAEVTRKEQEYRDLQEEVTRLGSKLDKVRQDHAAEMVRFRRDLEAGIYSGPVVLEVGDLETTVRELEEKISQMESAGDQLAESMENAAIGKWQSVEGEEAVSHELVDMVDQMRNMLVQAAHSSESVPSVQQAIREEETQKTVALQNFEKVYSQAMKLQVQMNNLRVSQLERNKEIMLIKRQLLLQEVNNVLLQAHITRREVELYQYREARRHAAVKRWSTFSTSDRVGRSQSGPELRPPLLRNNSLRESDQPLALTTAKGKHDIPLTSDKEIRVPALGVKVENGEVRTAFELYPFEAAPKDSRGQVERHQVSSGSAPAAPSCFTPTVVQQMDSTHAPPLTSTTHVGDTVAGVGQRAAVTSRPQDVLPHPGGPGIGKVAKGSPTLLSRKNDRSVIPAGNSERYALEIETPQTLIPQRSEAGEEDPSSASSALVVDEKYFPTKTVMECTESALDAGHLRGTSPEGTGNVDISSSKHQPKPERRSVQQQKDFRQQKDDADNGDPVRKATRKPPLPRQSTPQSPPTSKRSKSVGDVDGATAEDAGGERLPARDVMSRLKKCATVCETEERKLEFRKTPSPTLHLPRVGLVSRVRRLKPAAELLQESQRYRSGHTVYATRIMQRYLPPPPAKPPPPGGTTAQGKENVPGQGYVQAIVQRLSREGTPTRSLGSSSTSSSLSLSLQRTDSPKASSEFVSHVVQKLSSSGGPEPHKPHKTPLKDLSNEGQVKQLTHVFNADDACAPAEHQPLDTDGLDRRGSGGGDEGESPTATLPPSVSRLHALLEANPDSSTSPTSHASMPSLASDTAAPLAVDVGRARAATYSVKEAERPRSLQPQSVNGESIELIGEDLLHPRLTPEEGDSQKISPSSSTKSKNALCCQSSSCTKTKCSSTDSTKVKLPSSPKSQERRGGTERKETIGVLCKQSMSFDLGVSLKAQPIEAVTCVSSETETHSKSGGSSGEGSRMRHGSSGSDGEGTGSPPPSCDDKKKSRNRFLDSSWLQKPKKFFKVSK